MCASSSWTLLDPGRERGLENGWGGEQAEPGVVWGQEGGGSQC